MTNNEISKHKNEGDYEKHIENAQYREQLEHWYRKEKSLRRRIIWICLFFLCLSSFGQFAILDYSFGERLGLIDSDKVLGISIKVLLSLLVTAALPITTLLDESGILGERIKISLFGIKFSPILWIVLPGDILLTFQAVLAGNQNAKNPDTLLPTISFVLAAIFSTFAFYLSKGIVAALKKYMLARKNLQIIQIYGINPIPLYKDVEQIKLIEENEASKREAEELRKTIEEERIQYQQNLDSQQTQHQDKFISLEAEHNKQLEKNNSEIQKYKDKLDELSQLKTTFNKVSKPIRDLVSQGKKIFEDFSGLDESIKNFNFPKIEIPPTVDVTSVEKPTYYWRWQNSNGLWKDLELPSELSPIGYSLLSGMEEQNLPVPHIQNYAPREGLSKCLVLVFNNYGLIVYCRDEQYRKEGQQWDIEAEGAFQRKIADFQLQSYYTLVLNAQEIMSNQMNVLEQIKDLITSRIEQESN